jgi:hypothetical protein
MINRLNKNIKYVKNTINKPHITIVKVKCMMYIMNIIQDELIKMGWECSFIESNDINYYIDSNNLFHYFLFLFPLQINSKVIQYKRYILYQLEQNINNDMSLHYKKVNNLQQLYNNAALLIDYCDTNVKVTKKYYSNEFKVVNIPAKINYEMIDKNYEYDIIFVGFINDRRLNILNKLKEKYRVLIVENVYGSDLKNLCDKSNICLNIHFYENAILERVRLNEMMDYGIKLISEKPCLDDIDICNNYESVYFIDIIDLNNSINLDQLIETIERTKNTTIDYKDNLNKLINIFKKDIQILNINNFIKN